MIRSLPNYGSAFNKNNTINSISIGTIGADILDNRITSIDFKNQTISLYNERPLWMDTLSNFQSFDFKGRRFMLPANVGEKDLTLLFDTGCSSFGLITSKNRFDRYTDKNTPEITYDGNRFGDSFLIHHKSTHRRIAFGGVTLDLKRVSYVDMTDGLVTNYLRRAF